MKFGYYLINTYVPELDGPSPDLCAHWLEQIDAAEDLGFDSLWATEHHFRLFGGVSQEKILQSMERFARFVMPALRDPPSAGKQSRNG